jgi:hypothetical protein
MKKTKSTMKRIFNSPSRRRKGASPQRGKRSKPDDEPNNNQNENNKPRKFKIGNNRIPSSVGSVDDSLGLPPQITRTNDNKTNNKKTKNKVTSKKTSRFRPIALSSKTAAGARQQQPPSPPLDSRLDDTKDNIQTSFSHVDDATEESHRRNAFLYLDRYEDMVRAQDAEDDATITHLRPIFYTIRRLATQNPDGDGNDGDGDDDDDSSDGDDGNNGVDQTKVKVEQKLSIPKIIDEPSPKQVVKKDVDETKTKNNNNNTPGEPSKLLKTTSVEVIPSKNDMEIEATSFDVGGDGTDDEDDDDKDVDANEPLFPEGEIPDETSFTANHDQTFMDGGTNGVGGTTSSSKIPTGSNINLTKDTSFTANHDQTFMKPGGMGSSTNINEITVVTKGIPEIDRDDDSDEFVNDDEYGFVSTGYLDTTTNTITNLASIKNDHNILLHFSAISHFVHRIEAMNEAHEGSDIPPIASGPKSDYHILQTDAQLMLILTTIVDMVEEGEEEKGGEGLKKGLTFAEFVHVYKSVIAGMQTLQMMPPTTAGNSTSESDPYDISDVRSMTRDRTLQMIRSFTATSMPELMEFFGQEEDNDSTASPGGTKSRSFTRGGANKNTQVLLDSKDKELATLKDDLKKAESKNKGGGGSPFKVMLLSLLIGFGAGYQYFTHLSNELNKIDIIAVKSELSDANKQIKSFQSEIDDLVVDLSAKDGALVKKDEEFLKCEKTLRTIEDYYNGDVTKLKLELEECQESSRFNPSESNVQEAKMVIKSSQSLQKVVMHRQVMTAVGTALIAAVPSFLKFLLNVLFF